MGRKCREGWDAVVEEFYRSGLTPAEFSEQRGIPRTTLGRWLARAAAAPQAGPPPMLPVRVVTAATPAPAAPREALRVPLVEVALRDGVVVRCLVGTDVGYVGTLVERLR